MENINEIIDGIEYSFNPSFDSVIKESDFLLKIATELSLSEIENTMNLLKQYTTIKDTKEDKYFYNKGIEGDGLTVTHIITFINLIGEKYKNVFTTATGTKEY